jgi:hypothetical protein
MKTLIAAVATAAALTAASVAAPTPAYAGDDGRVVAGVAGGLLGGLLIGGALAPRPYAPPPPAPVYYDGPPPEHCYWTRGEPVWDDYAGAWRRPRIHVCD